MEKEHFQCKYFRGAESHLRDQRDQGLALVSGFFSQILFIKKLTLCHCSCLFCLLVFKEIKIKCITVKPSIDQLYKYL